MKQDKFYRQFWLATKDFKSPPRFGLDWFLSAIDKVWEKKSISMDWDDMEGCLVDVLQSERLDDTQKVRVCKEAINAFTRRGHFEPQDQFGPVPTKDPPTVLMDEDLLEMERIANDMGWRVSKILHLLKELSEYRSAVVLSENEEVTLRGFAYAVSQVMLAGIEFTSDQGTTILNKLQALADEANDVGYDSLPGAAEDHRASEAAHARKQRGSSHQEESSGG